MKLTLAAGLFVAASAAALAQAPAGSSTTPNSSPQQRQPAQTPQQTEPQGEQTLTGCLTSADNIYTLTVMDDSGAPGTTASTTVYTLAPGTGVDLKAHLNKRITVKGTDVGPDTQNSARVVVSSPATPAPTGTSGTAAAGANNRDSATDANGTPTVQTTAKARINTKMLNVTDVQPAAGSSTASCGA